MRSPSRKCFAAIANALATVVLPTNVAISQQNDSQPAGQSNYRISVNTNIVLTNVVVRDKKTGAVVKGLKGSDFTILENGKPQKMASFDYQSVDQAAVLAEKGTVRGK